MKKINIGLLGWGTVGTGVVKLLQSNSRLIARRLGASLLIKRIADLDLERKRKVKVDRKILTRDARDVINDPEIDIVVELIGGYEPAKTYILESLKAGKRVVTANKALLARDGDAIFEAAQRAGMEVGFEASVGGGIPIVRSLNEGFVGNRIQSILGIINGTANYILSRMSEEGEEFVTILKGAQEKGYAEADPTIDVEGIDAAHKLAILVRLAFGTKIGFKAIYTEGITRITPLDLAFAHEFGYRVKLLAIAKRDKAGIEARVHPTMVPQNSLLAEVRDVFNAIYVTGDAMGPMMLYGKGAGMMPTASAVVGDMVEIAHSLLGGGTGKTPTYLAGKDLKVKDMEELVGQYYLRFRVVDRPGVLAQISGILGKHQISIASVIQKGRRVEKAVPIVIMTHEAKEREIRRALEKIDRLQVVRDKTVFIRIENRLS
jgi:homoserine dehydrogenase